MYLGNNNMYKMKIINSRLYTKKISIATADSNKNCSHACQGETGNKID